MRYFTASITIVDGQTVYGNLPRNFAVGHELDGTVYLQLPKEVEILEEYGLTEIDEQTYTVAVNTIQENERLRRQNEQESLTQQVKARRQEIDLLQLRTDGMQVVDDYTLNNMITIDERTAGMQDIDQYALDLILQLQAKVDELEQRIIQLEGGTP